MRLTPTILAALILPSLLGAQDAAKSGAFVMLLGTDTVAVERFRMAGDTLSGEIAVRGQARIEYTAHVDAGGLVPALAIRAYAPNSGPDAAPAQQVQVSMRGDSAFVITGAGTRAFQTADDALPLINNSFALTELYTRRARAAGDSLDLPAWSLNGGVTLSVAVRSIGPDSLTVTIAGQVHRLRVDAEGRILGGTVPSQRLGVSRVTGPAAATIGLGKPDYSAPAGAPYTATEVTVPGPGDFTLGGTLTVPSNATGPVPAVVTITGSGQQDRDEYIPVAGGYRPFRQVADTLGRRGIAVLRLDDRTIGASGGTPGTSADYADDVRAALAWLRARPGIDGDRLALLGHSEGGLIAPMVAATDPRLKGIVLMAGPSQTGAAILAFQQKQAIDGDTSIAVASRDSAYRAARRITDSLATASPWFAYFMQHDPLATAREVTTVPVLVLHGATDRQVTADQAPVLAEAFRTAGNPDVTLQVFPDLNHLFIPDPNGLPTGYATLTDNKVAPRVLGTLADWLAVRLEVP